MAGPESTAPSAPEQPSPPPRFQLAEGETLRGHAARGVVVNAVFNSGLTVLTFLRGFVLAAFLSPEDYGIWGILLVTLGTLAWLKQVGVGDKYVQQDEDDQELAFQRAFTIELILNTVLFAVLVVAVPVLALAYGRAELLAPGFAMCLLVPAIQGQVPFWVLYRRLEFRRQRTLQAIDPLVAFVVSIALAIGGAGYWAFILGTLAGSWTGAVVAMRNCPYPIALRYDGATLRSYAGFSAPLFVASIGGIVFAQGSVFFVSHAAGVAAAGVVTLAAQIFQLTQRVDDVVTATLYPVVCSVRERRDLLYETFEKSNRLALIWALPFGLGLALFADDLVHFVIGEEWRPAITVLQATGVAAALSQIGFSWTSYCRALGDTRPIAVNSLAVVAAFLAVGVPLLYALDLDGYALCVLVVTVVGLLVRGVYLARLFRGFRLVGHGVRAMLPVVPAVAAVLAVRAVAGSGDRTAARALAELVLFLGICAVATWFAERRLIAEALGYVRRRRAVTTG